MIRRLLALWEHARAGHRIGCVRCTTIRVIEFVSRRYDETGNRIADEPPAAFIDELRAAIDGKPVPPYVADPDELPQGPVGEYRESGRL